MSRGLEFLEPKEHKHRSIKQKLDKNRFCKKNKIGSKNFGPHTYQGSNLCVLCGHVKKDPRKRW